MTAISRLVQCTAILLVSGLLAACTQQAEIKEVSPETAAAGSDPHAGLSIGDALGLGGMGGADAGTPALSWEKPDGWQELGSTSMRVANFRVGESGECYVTILPGSAGGMLANVNRWRKQVGLPDMDEVGIDALPRLEMLGGQAVLVDFEGTYQGMSGDENKGGYRMMGALLEQGGQSYFVKMVGAQADLAGQMDALKAFCQSLAVGETTTAAAAPMAIDPHAGMDLPDGHPPVDAWKNESMAIPSPGADLNATLRWTAPESWVRSADRPMRLVTYSVEGHDDVQCYISILAGDGGGVERNLNRWRRQVGLEPLLEADLDTLPVVEVLGTMCPYLAMEGTFTGMSGEAQSDYGVLGLVCLLDDQSIFVKMTGPSEVVLGEEENFKAFCASLHLEDGNVA